MKGNEMDNEKSTSEPAQAMKGSGSDDRRDAIKKLGKYAAYVAPFTVLALSAKGAHGFGSGTKSH